MLSLVAMRVANGIDLVVRTGLISFKLSTSQENLLSVEQETCGKFASMSNRRFNGRNRRASHSGDAQSRRLQHVALNVAKIVNMRSDPVLRSDVIDSDIVGIGGMGIVGAARWFGLPVQECAVGIDRLHRTADVILSQFPPIQLADYRTASLARTRSGRLLNRSRTGGQIACSLRCQHPGRKESLAPPRRCIVHHGCWRCFERDRRPGASDSTVHAVNGLGMVIQSLPRAASNVVR
jgi:hypothetical protein